ncbi:MAG: ATP-binding protein [Geobacter sp.]|nr:ATP-binding protein [Geobacter sp.]
MNPTNRRNNRLLIGTRIEAKYSESEEPLHRHNCFIEALPQALTPVQVSGLISRYPVYDEQERTLPPQRRLFAVQRIANCIFPMPEFLEIEQKFSRMIRGGYMDRNPLESEWARQLRSGFPELEKNWADYGIQPLIRSTAAGFAIIGCSGVGKSTIVESILSLYPQVIVHTKYNETPFDQQQLVWLKLDCPFDGSLKGLCFFFFEAIDQILGTRYAKKYENPRLWSVDKLLPIMSQLAGSLGMGVLAIDEIQRLSLAKSGGAEKMLNFFVELTNTFGVPVVLLGTFKAFSLFSEEIAMARRMAGQGDVVISNLQQDELWDRFISKLWKYQWTREPTPLSPKLSKVMYEESQGIVDIAVKIYMLTQWSVIGEEDERLTPGRIREVAKGNFHMLRPILQALRFNDTDFLSKVTDVVPVAGQMERFFAAAVKRVSLYGTVDNLANQERQVPEDEGESFDSPVYQIGSLLAKAGHPVPLSMRWAQQAVERFAAEADLKLATSEAFRLAAEHELQTREPAPPVPTLPKTKTAKVISLSGDLREIAKPALKKKSSVYVELKAAGVIKPATEFLAGVGG